MKITCYPNKFCPGVESEADDWRVPPPHDAVRPVGEVLDVQDAFARTWRTDAHFSLYTIKGATRQPRINKAGLAIVRGWGYEVEIHGLCADVDNPEHAPWSSVQEAREDLMRVREAIPTCGVYTTLHGYRIIQPTDRPMSPEEYEGAVLGWFGQLQEHGVFADRACKDWTRFFRLPHVLRNGANYRSHVVAID